MSATSKAEADVRPVLANHPHEGELGRAIDGDREIGLPPAGAHLGNVDVEIADRVTLELLPRWLVAFDVGQPTDAVTLQAAM